MFIADFHIHSKYSRATSREMDIENLSKWARLKGVDLLGTGDFTHPDWLRELKNRLERVEHGIYSHRGIKYILTVEVNNIYFKAGKTRKVHNIIFAPSFDDADEINKMLSQYGTLFADGRPILKIECDEMVKELVEINEEIFVVPAHVWTPHFGLFGANSGFDSIEECYEDQTDRIYSLETGLSSDPAMNWRLPALDRFCLTSNSDAHSPAKIGREANVFDRKFDYKELIDILKTKDTSRFLFTVEFYPQEGKYHWDGHRKCNVPLSPAEARTLENKCPVCGRKITVGVMHRVEKLGTREDGFVLKDAPAFRNMVPLVEIVADALGMGVASKGVQHEYHKLISALGSEFAVLLELSEDKIREKCPPKIAQGIINVREHRVNIFPGYDGKYGKVRIFEDQKEKQTELF